MGPDRVLLAAPHYPPRRVGGVELGTLRAARWLSEHNIAVSVVCVETLERGSRTHATIEDDVVDRVQVRRLHITLGRNEDSRLWADAPVVRAQIERLLDEVRPDLLHLCSGYLLGSAPIRAAAGRGIPTIATLTDFAFLCPTIQLLRADGSLCYGPEPLECVRCLHGRRRSVRLLERAAPATMRSIWKMLASAPAPLDVTRLREEHARLDARHAELVAALNTCDAIVAYTRFAADLHVLQGVKPDRIVVRPVPLDRAEFDPIDVASPPPGEIHFAYLGQVVPVKGLELLVRAFVQLLDSTGTGSTPYLHVHGHGEAAYIERLRRLAGGSPRITFDGRYEHRRALNLAHGSNVVVVTSLWHENVPRIIGEAFAAGRPVIAPRVKGVTETVTDNVNGLLFERGDVADLARALQRATTDPDLLTRLARGIPATAAYEDHMRSMLEMYRAAAQRRFGQGSR